jgi:hypothetical protein
MSNHNQSYDPLVSGATVIVVATIIILLASIVLLGVYEEKNRLLTFIILGFSIAILGQGITIVVMRSI